MKRGMRYKVKRGSKTEGGKERETEGGKERRGSKYHCQEHLTPNRKSPPMEEKASSWNLAVHDYGTADVDINAVTSKDCKEIIFAIITISRFGVEPRRKNGRGQG